MQSCRSCHFSPDEDGTIHQEFSALPSDCGSCHQDVHNRQFEETGGTNCRRCHDAVDWSARKFDHDLTAFKLEGKHEGVACGKCHKPVITADITYTLYKLKDSSCESCH